MIGEKQSNISIGSHNNNSILLQGIEHIHGYTNDRMVMGVNDVTQISNTSFHKNQDIIEAIVKINCNQAFKHTIEETCKQQISAVNIICFFGSSIGDTDNMWWELIGQRLTQDCQLIIFSKGDDIPSRIGYKKGRKERKIRDAFQSKSKMTEEVKRKTANKIFIGLNSNIFNLTKDRSSI